jgi:hypothetical protein
MNLTEVGTTPVQYPSLAESVLGITERSDAATMVAQAHYTLTGEHVDGQSLLEEEGQLWEIARREGFSGCDVSLYGPDAETIERAVALNNLKISLQDGTVPYANVLGALPLYQAMYLEHAAHNSPVPPDRKALLVGSLSTVSSAAFVVLSNSVFAAEPWIVDPRSSQAKRRHGNFVEANGLALPEAWSNNMHTVVVNRLLHMLLDTDNRLASPTPAAEQGAARIFAREMFRVLQAGGHFLLCERPTGLDITDWGCKSAYNQQLVATFDGHMTATLEHFGFTDVTISSGWRPETTDYLFEPFDPRRPLTTKIKKPGTRAIYARKPEK